MPSSYSTSPLRVLVVDDNEPSATSVKSAIEDLGDRVEACFNGRDALSLVHRFRPEILLLDIGMPGLGGLEVAAILRNNPAFAAMKIIAQTGAGDSDTRRRTAAAGFDLHLAKPLSFQVLADMLSLLRDGPRPLALNTV